MVPDSCYLVLPGCIKWNFQRALILKPINGGNRFKSAFNICLHDMKAVGQKEEKALKYVWIALHRNTNEIKRT